MIIFLVIRTHKSKHLTLKKVIFEAQIMNREYEKSLKVNV